MNCLNCNLKIIKNKPKRIRKFCSDYCCHNFWQKNNKEKFLKIRNKYEKKHKKEILKRKKEWQKKDRIVKIDIYREKARLYYRKYHPEIKHKPKGEGWISKRENVLKRDNYLCLECGDKATEVHHIDGNGSSKGVFQRNDSFSNLISLCHSCHIKLELLRLGDFSKGKNTLDFGRNKQIIKLSKIKKYKEIGLIFGISKQRVHQIINKYNSYLSLKT